MSTVSVAMKAGQPDASGWINRRGYGVAAVACAVFVVYGSLVPLVFRPVPFGQALRQFSNALSSPLFVDSNTDFVTNILLTIPLGYLALAATMTDRHGRVLRFAAAVLTVPACFAVSALAEFAQVFSQGRTDSLSDLVAQAAGAVFGVALWLLMGDRVTRWLRDSLDERERPALAQRILLGYCVLFAISQVMPLDLTVSLGQLAQKYRNGMILLRPFAYLHPSPFEMWWDYFGDVALNVPVGAAAVVLWTRNRSARWPPAAFVLGVAAVVLIELAQVFVNSRFADTTDVLTGSLGVLVGVAAATALTHRETSRQARRGLAQAARFARLGAAAWVVALMAYHWYPFDFTVASDRVTLGMHQLFSVPFSSYYFGSEFHAFTEMTRKALLALPLGVLLGLSSRSVGKHAERIRSLLLAATGFCVLVGIEVGQVFLPPRMPDITDALIGEIGVLAGLWLASRFTMEKRASALVGATHPSA